MEKISNEQFGQFIAQLRKEHNLTQRELAQQLSISDKAVSKWERGISLPDISILLPLSQILGVTTTEILSAKRLDQSTQLTVTEIDGLVSAVVNLNKKEPKISNNERLLLVFALLAVVFIGGGVLSFFAYNWEIFSRGAKAFVALLPLVTCQTLLIIKTKQNASQIWIQSLCLAVGMFFITALGLIYQAYQLSFSLNSMLVITYMLMLPIIYIFDAYPLAILSLGGVLFTGFQFAASPYLPILIIPYYIYKYNRVDRHNFLTFMLVCWSIMLPPLISGEYGLWASIMILFMWAIQEREPTCKNFIRIFIYASAFALTFVDYGDYSEMFSMLEPFTGLLTFIPCIYLFVRNRPKTTVLHEKLDFFALTTLLCTILFCTTAFFVGTPISLAIMEEVLNIIMSSWLTIIILALSIAKITLGMKSDNYDSARRYITVLNSFVLLKVLSSNASLLLKAATFIGVGIALLATNYIISKRSKQTCQ